MTKPTSQDSSTHAALQTKLLSAEVSFSQQPFVRPLILSTGAIESITQADATVRVSVNGVESEGSGCIYLSDLWAWPDPAFDHDQRDAAMRAYCQQLADQLPTQLDGTAHPLAFGLRLHEGAVHHEPTDMDSPVPPALARSVCLSIFDAAIHDAVGRALHVSAFDLYDDVFAIPEADTCFGGEGNTARAIQSLLETEPRTTSPAWWIVGKTDDLEADLKPAVEQFGLFAFKLKIMGQDAKQDAERVSEVVQAAKRWGINHVRVTIDSNEANPDAESVTAFLDHLQTIDADAYDILEMIEQPTGRDIEQHVHDWREVASRKPILLDEGLMTLASMQLAQDQHWSGFALKTCKGHSFALVAAAWAHKQNMTLSLQDLTNPGLSAVHAAMFASRVPTMNGVELNSPQFTPKANEQWAKHYPSLFNVKNGLHQLPPSNTLGLGGKIK